MALCSSQQGERSFRFLELESRGLAGQRTTLAHKQASCRKTVESSGLLTAAAEKWRVYGKKSSCKTLLEFMKTEKEVKPRPTFNLFSTILI